MLIIASYPEGSSEEGGMYTHSETQMKIRKRVYLGVSYVAVGKQSFIWGRAKGRTIMSYTMVAEVQGR